MSVNGLMGFENGVVAANHPLVAEASLKILRDGGNVVDAAVAASFMMGVVVPATSGLGGGGFMTIRLAEGPTSFIDYREVAPIKASPDMYVTAGTLNLLPLHGEGEVRRMANRIGHRAVAVPGALAGLSLALDEYGSLSLGEVIRPAIAAARGGFEVNPFMSSITKEDWDDSLLKLRNFTNLSEIFLRDGRPYEAGERMVRRDLAETYEKIARVGCDAFYRGEIAELIARDMEEHGGLITERDLDGYRPALREPVSGTYRGHEITSSPPPSSGGTHIIQILNILEGFDVSGLGHNTPAAIHLLCEVMKRAYADRSRYMADPDFASIPLRGLLSKGYAEELREQVDADGLSMEVGPGNPIAHEGGETATFCVADGEGNMVAMSETVECFFGSGVVVPGTGILLNDEMHDFDPRPGNPNSIEPGKRPLSSMSPTTITREGRPLLCFASTGGRRIISSSVQIINNILGHGLSIQDAISAPRFFHAEGDVINVESQIPRSVRRALETMGYRIEVEGPYMFGAASGTSIDEGGRLHAGVDPRRQYAAMGY